MIAYYGGGFDPIHNGHLFTASIALKLFGLDQVRFVLTARPVHKDLSGRGVPSRWKMLKLALHNEKHMVADDIEISASNRQSYTYDTLGNLRKKHRDTKPLFWLMGSDQFAVLESWYRGLELISLAHIVVFARPALSPDKNRSRQMQKFIDRHSSERIQDFTCRPAGKLYFAKQPMLDISSTRIREHLNKGTGVQDLLPAGVLSYIMEQRIYPTGDSE